MKLYFDDDSFDGQLQRSVGKADSGMANVGECLAISPSKSIRVIGTAGTEPGPSLPPAWSSEVMRRRPPATGSSARGVFLRAAEYFRQAFFFHRENLDGHGLRTAYGSSVRGLPGRPAVARPPCRGPVRRPVRLLLRSEGVGDRLPTLLHIGGYDGTAEELYASVAPALERGYAFAAIDGPGQGSELYYQRVPMRPDWEAVVPGMVDVLTKHPGVDSNRIVLVGRSFGGLIAPRGASAGARLAAMIVDPGQFEMGSALDRSAWRPGRAGGGPGRRQPVPVVAHHPSPPGPIGPSDGHPRPHQCAGVLPRSAPLYQRGDGCRDHLPQFRDRQRDRHPSPSDRGMCSSTT